MLRPIGPDGTGQYRFASQTVIAMMSDGVALWSEKESILRDDPGFGASEGASAVSLHSPVVQHLGGIWLLIRIEGRHYTRDPEFVRPCRKSGGWTTCVELRHEPDDLAVGPIVRLRHGVDQHAQSARRPRCGLSACAFARGCNVREPRLLQSFEANLITESVAAQWREAVA